MVATSRISWIDYAKVLCIWLMVCGHAGQEGMIQLLSYQFHMPAFFLISGILYRPKGVRVTLKSLGVPILFYGLLYLTFRLFLVLFKAGFDWTVCSNEFITVGTQWIQSFVWCLDGLDVFPGAWFVFVLLFMRLLMEIGLVRKYKWLFLFFCFAWCSLEPFIDIPAQLEDLKVWHILSAFPFFITGLLIKERRLNVMAGSFEVKLLAVALFVVLAIIQGCPEIFVYNYGLNYALFFLNALLGSWLLFNLCDCAPAGRHWIVSLSNGTLLILGLHFEIYPYMTVAFRYVTGIYNAYLPLLIGFMVMVVCYPLIRFCEKHCPILLGKTG